MPRPQRRVLPFTCPQLGILDYVISQTSLEQVYLQLVKKHQLVDA
jgi:hypothetical protein